MKFKLFGICLILTAYLSVSHATNIKTGDDKVNNSHTFWISNDQIKCSVQFEADQLSFDVVESLPQWTAAYNSQPIAIKTDADFALEVMWTDWSAPNRVNNADNPVEFSKQDFQLLRYETKSTANAQEWTFYLSNDFTPLLLELTYQLAEESFYIRRKLAVADTSTGLHFLQKISPRMGFILNDISILKMGGFGQPIAFTCETGGAFMGLEYPASDNSIRTTDNNRSFLQCSQEIGEKIGATWIKSEWVVQAVTPNNFIKLWYTRYLNDIRIAPLKPYTLYNSWYDLRAPVMVQDSGNVLNETNILRMIDLFRKNMINKYNVQLDAFVLDDGWDVYKSDWVLRKKQFPRGLKPISDELKKSNTNLGIWVGPIGGYSHRDWRVQWMFEHGYEVVGDQLCLAGKNYRQLFKNRVVNLVENEGVGYYKWDGIQFSCSESDHGHPIGIYSRRAVMESVIDICRAVREKNPNIFLNITSGTWLSPWWMKYTNMIWMQGSDYGYANVPSISRRDRAITYRDFVLYEDFKKNDLWFPISNLMTHGIIKGHLQKLGGEQEPLDKFTDNTLLYFARGVTMWELYISPDLLTDGEWNAIAKSIQWAKDRFPTLISTEMIGGDPGERDAYGYVHANGDYGIIAVRNPFIEPTQLTVQISASWGFNRNGSNFVLQRVYPSNWISPKLYNTQDTLWISLDGYETAIYEISPLKEAKHPLIAGVTFDIISAQDNRFALKLLKNEGQPTVLNPQNITSIQSGEKVIDPTNFQITLPNPTDWVSGKVFKSNKSTIDLKFTLDESVAEATLALLLEPIGEFVGEQDPVIIFNLDGQEVTPEIEAEEGQWGWYKIKVKPGEHNCHLQISAAEWMGKAAVWLIGLQQLAGADMVFELAKHYENKPVPPKPWKDGYIRHNQKLGEVQVNIN